MKNILAIDIGGTSIKYAIVKEDGEINFKGEIKTRVTQTDNFILSDVENLIKNIIVKYDIIGVAISTAGVVCCETGIISYAGPTIPNYKGTDFKKMIQEKYNLPCSVENDVNSAAIGEFWKGAASASKSVFCITVGTGLGGALIIDGKLINGASSAAGEIGYLKVDGECVQKVASTTGLVNEVAERKNMNTDEINGVEIFKLAKSGDVIAIDAINNLVKNLIKAIENIVYIVNPECIILGGGIMEQKDYLKPIIIDEFERVIPSSFREKTKIDFASLGNNAGIIGAVYKLKNEVLDKKE